MVVAAGAKVDHLQPAPARLLEEDVLRFQVAVDNPVAVEHVEALEDGVAELTHEGRAETLELVPLDELVEVHAEELKGEADVVPEREVVDEVDDVVRAVGVLLPQVLQYPYLLHRLPVEPLLVPHDLQRHVLLRLVVERLEHLTEAPLAQHLDHLVAVLHVIVRHGQVAAGLVVVAAVAGSPGHPLTLLGVLTGEVHLREGEHFLLLEGRQLAAVHAEGLLRGEELRLLGHRRGGGGGRSRRLDPVARGSGGRQGAGQDRRKGLVRVRVLL